MYFLILFVLIALSIEIVIRTKYYCLIKKLIYYISRSNKVILNKNYSDHWKEKTIPKYSIRIMKTSIYMFLVCLAIIILFYTASVFINNFSLFVLSLKPTTADQQQRNDRHDVIKRVHSFTNCTGSA